ncbi:MAG: Asp23/Gls24 family envelope stress response protein [Pseudonocardiaceae bacterium]
MTSAATHPLPSPAGPASPNAVDPSAVDPSERGRLRIDPAVLRKIAERTADLTAGTLPAPRTLAGVSTGHTGATAKVTVTGQQVDVHIRLALRYPGPVRPTVDQVRRGIDDEVRRITGYQVCSITVTVTALLPEPSPGLQ